MLHFFNLILHLFLNFIEFWGGKTSGVVSEVCFIEHLCNPNSCMRHFFSFKTLLMCSGCLHCKPIKNQQKKCRTFTLSKEKKTNLQFFYPLQLVFLNVLHHDKQSKMSSVVEFFFCFLFVYFATEEKFQKKNPLIINCLTEFGSHMLKMWDPFWTLTLKFGTYPPKFLGVRLPNF